MTAATRMAGARTARTATAASTPSSVRTSSARRTADDCDTCHTKYEDALDPGHMYDDTPEKAEVTFIPGLSKDGKYENDGNCSNLCCHGDAKTPSKTIKQTDSQLACKGCHAQ